MTDNEHFDGVVEFPMAELMSQHSHHFLHSIVFAAEKNFEEKQQLVTIFCVCVKMWRVRVYCMLLLCANLDVGLVHKGVKQHNAFVLAESKKIRIAVARSLGTILEETQF